ncbi:MAG: ATP-binding protein [Pseudomonadota bacterium]
MWERLSIRAKLFVVLVASSAAAIAIMLAVVASTMSRGFAHYLVQTEIGILEPLADALAERYRPFDPTWSEHFSNQAELNAFVRRNMPPPAVRGVPGPPRASPPRAGAPRPDDAGRPPPRAQDGAPPRPGPDGPPRGAPGGPRGPGGSGDPMMVASRLSILGPKSEPIAGYPPDGRVHGRVPIEVETPSGPETVGYVALASLKQPVGGDRIFLIDQLQTLLLSALAALALAGVLAAIFSREIVRPIRQLADVTRTLSSGDYTVRAAGTRRDELGALMADVDVLARTLEANEKANRSWLSDTSHELKTPLAVLRAEIEAVQDGIRNASPDVLSEMHDAVMRLARLVEDVGTLARMRESYAPPDSVLDLSHMLDDAAERHRHVLEAAGLSLTTDVARGLRAQLHELRFTQVLDNLIENARRYTAAPGVLRLAARAEGDVARIVVEDTPPRPADADLDRLFERFFRAEASRSREHGGSGLGLAICQAIVEAQGGSIAVGPSDLGGLRATITVPLKPDPAPTRSVAEETVEGAAPGLRAAVRRVASVWGLG